MSVLNCVVNLVKYSTKLNVHSMAEHIPITRADAVTSAIELLKFGAVIAVPTDTVYGLACDATNSQAIQKLYNVKCRNENKPVAICLGEIPDIKLWASTKHLPNSLLNYLLPGPVTLILNSINKLDPSLCYRGKVGIRIPDYNFIRELASGLGKPLALTSANLSNQPSAVTTLEFQSVWDKIPAVFDGGITHINRSGSTIIDLSEKGAYSIIREGVAYRETINILEKFELKRQYE